MAGPAAGEKGVLFVCVENSARSQMAEGFLRKMAPHVHVQSAGTRPGAEINPVTVAAMSEVGIDITGQSPKAVTPDMISGDDTITVNMGCMDRDECPALFVKDVADWQIEDPKGKGLDEVRAIRDAIRDRVQELVRGMDCGRSGDIGGGGGDVASRDAPTAG